MFIIADRVYKKELTKDQFLHAILTFVVQTDPKNTPDNAVHKLEEMLVHIFVGSWAKVWFVEKEALVQYENGAVSQKITPDAGILWQVLTTKEPLLVHVVAKEPIYVPTFDNIDGLDNKDMMVVPILNEENTPILLLQVATSLRDLQQFTQTDLNVMAALQPYVAHLYETFLNPKGSSSTVLKTTTVMSLDETPPPPQLHVREQFLVEVTENMRTPVTTMMGLMDRLKQHESDPQKSLYLENATKNGSILLTLLNDVSDFLTLEQGTLVLQEDEFSPIDVFSHITAFFWERLQQGELSFYLFVDPNLPNTIYSDSHRLKQILFNLIDNAIKFTPTNGVISVEITYEPRDTAIIFSVEDTGIGISEIQKSSIFDPYSQTKDPTVHEYGGTGLGLAISAKLAHLFGTHLAFKSTQMQGSSFTFTLPLAGKIRDNRFPFDLSLIVTFRPILIFDKTHFPIRKLLLRYLKSFGCGIENIMILNAWKQIEGITPTHIFCDDENIHPKWIQPLLDKGVKLIVIPNTLLEETLHDLQGDVSMIECTFNLTQLYDVLKNGQFQRDSFRTERADEVIQREGYLLIVDANTTNSKFLREMGEKFGLEVITTSDEQEAMQMYINGIEANHPCTLILMDEMMNETGMATSILKFEEEYQLAHTPVICINHHQSEENNRPPLTTGVDMSLVAPITIQKLSAVFERYLPQKSVSNARA